MDWSELVEDKTAHLAHEDALDLIGRLLRYDHASRLTCKEAMDHEYFADVDFE